ncbi:hypothetical protein K435DRAFT_683749 [Dendrothele bispora CBS 962.96]|uniref:Tat pathway signal sequence n=1 Tax=Dendrothele bispora (strain CBS 962.96) TaxID=1314807 RepID=A0A4S8LC08_DENBC|nr:hypothetical protein K435DRAFT_683749 [Dendrothele bispora CBS 962.96]
MYCWFRQIVALTIFLAPLQRVVEPQLVKFTFGIDDSDKTIYQGAPSQEVDTAWYDLYRYLAVAVPKSEAAKMANRTSPIPGDELNYIIIPDVFHTLHCLNIIRRALYPEHYQHSAENLDLTRSHVNHCIDTIRQSLMCCSDVSPIVWRWNETRNLSEFRSDVVHECRNFEKIQEWAKEHHVDRYDRAVHVEDDLDIPTLYF